MSKVRQLPIYRAGYALVMLAMKEARGFSRDLRPTLGRRIQAKSHNARAALCREALRQGYSVDHRFTKVYRRAV